MNDEKTFVASLVDTFQIIGPSRAKAMFGGYGIYIDECMVGLVADAVLYLKVDKALSKQYADKGLPHFTFVKNDKPVEMSYCQAPEELFDDLALMLEWLEKSFIVAKQAKKARIK